MYDCGPRVWICRLALSCLFCACCFYPFVSQAQDGKPAPAPKKHAADVKMISTLITQLGDDAFDKREAAEKSLANVGGAALELVRKAAKESADAEVRIRAGRIVLDIELNSPNGWYQDFRKAKALTRLIEVPESRHSWACADGGGIANRSTKAH